MESGNISSSFLYLNGSPVVYFIHLKIIFQFIISAYKKKPICQSFLLITKDAFKELIYNIVEFKVMFCVGSSILSVLVLFTNDGQKYKVYCLP